MSRKPVFDPEGMPPMGTSAFLDMTKIDLAHENIRLSKGQVGDWLRHPVTRHIMARVKRLARDKMNECFSGVAMPKGVERESPRQAYYTGLVNADRSLLDFQRVVWQEACLADAADQEQEDQTVPEPEENIFGDDTLTEEG